MLSRPLRRYEPYLVAWLMSGMALCFTMLGTFIVEALNREPLLTTLLLVTLVAPIAEEPIKIFFLRKLKLQEGAICAFLYGLAESVSYANTFYGFDIGVILLRMVISPHLGYYFVGVGFKLGKLATVVCMTLHSISNLACWIIIYAPNFQSLGKALYYLNLFAILLISTLTIMNKRKK